MQFRKSLLFFGENHQKAALMLPWAVLMVLRYAKLFIKIFIKIFKIIKIFKVIGFSIDIRINLKEVDFLDITLNLQNGYRKLNDRLLYIQLNHHCDTIYRKSSNSYKIPSLKECRKILLTKKLLLLRKLNMKIH